LNFATGGQIEMGSKMVINIPQEQTIVKEDSGQAKSAKLLHLHSHWQDSAWAG
jgi:hypothetical protein